MNSKRTRVIYFLISFMLFLSLLWSAGCSSTQVTVGPTIVPHGIVDDWKYDSQAMAEALQSGTAVPSTATYAVSPKMGFSTGGAKDIQNFRENIKNDYLPLPTDITYEGLFYDYYFDTGDAEESDKLFYPSYCSAVTSDPFSGEVAYYLSVGLNSGLKESDFQRKKLNLVIVLDISGSMGSPFDAYYYDQFGNKVMLPKEEAGKTKMQIANESVVALLNHLNNGDSFGMVLFSDDAFLAKPLSPVAETDMESIKNHVLDIKATNSTNLDAGMQMGTGLFSELTNMNADEYENRIIFLTDAMPNQGDTSEKGLLGMTRSNSLNHIYSTFIGIGVDFNTELTETITKIRGANYYSVHSSAQFKERLDDEFEYMVTPLVFNLQLTFKAAGWEIEKVYGSPEADEATGQLMKVNTLFPSKTESGQTRGGLVLLKLKKTGEDGSIALTVSYEDRQGNVDGSQANIELASRNPEYFQNNGIRKGVVLSRYADLLKNWVIDERNHAHISYPWEPCINKDTGIIVPPDILLGQWERQSLPLMVSEPYQKLFGSFLNYFNREISAIGDASMSQEVAILETLINK
jgi:Ca-activated chloride channel homolog